MAGTSLYIVHLANKQGMDAVTQARNEGYPIFAETCPQYLHSPVKCTREREPETMSAPSHEGKASQNALWNGIKNGNITTIATDHCPFTKAEKGLGNQAEGRQTG